MWASFGRAWGLVLLKHINLVRNIIMKNSVKVAPKAVPKVASKTKLKAVPKATSKVVAKPAKKSRLKAIIDCPSDPVNVYLSSLAPSGRRSIRIQLCATARLLNHKGTVESFPWHQLRYEHAARVRFVLLEQGKAVNTINMTLSAIRGVMNTAFNLELIDADTMMRIKAVKCVKGSPTKVGHSLSKKEINKLLNTCKKDTSVKGIRDTALLALMLTTGLRRNEVANLELSDYEEATGGLVSRSGKGRKRHEMQLPKQTRQYLKKWFKYRGMGEGPLFSTVLKSERVTTTRLTTGRICDIVKRRTKDAGVTVCTPHDLRRTFVTRLLDNNVDINTVRQMVGHADIATTCRYDRRSNSVEGLIEMII